MQRVSKFEKVSLEQFKRDVLDNYDFSDDFIVICHQDLSLPKRATTQAAGYDFHLPFDLVLNPGDSVKIPTGIRSQIEDGWVLQIFPRSSLGFKYKLQLDNTVGIIDADYYNADNEGHIIAKISNNGDKMVELKKGDRFVQGIFVPFGITMDDDTDARRIGGFGSTDK